MQYIAAQCEQIEQLQYQCASAAAMPPQAPASGANS